MKRREVREKAFELLFKLSYDYESSDQFKLFFETNDKIKGKNKEFVEEIVNGTKENEEEILEIINKSAKGWTTDRMSRVDLTILMLAVFEIKYREDIPIKVSINEAIEIAKKYGMDKSPGFINGILGDIVG